MSAETIFNLTVFSLIFACVMGCGIAAAVELSTEWRFRRKMRKAHNKRRASFRRRYS